MFKQVILTEIFLPLSSITLHLVSYLLLHQYTFLSENKNMVPYGRRCIDQQIGCIRVGEKTVKLNYNLFLNGTVLYPNLDFP